MDTASHWNVCITYIWVIQINLEDIFVKSSSSYYYCCIDLQHQWFYCITPSTPTNQLLLLWEVPFQITCLKAKPKIKNNKPTKQPKNPHKTHSLYCTSHTSLCIYIFKYATIKKKVYGTLLNISLRSWWNHRCLKKSSIPQNKVKLN